MNRTLPFAPDYSLYGEPAASGFPDTLHIERLSVRSGPRRWRISPHRHPSLHQLFWIEHGGGALFHEDGESALFDASFVNMPAGTTHGFRFAPGTQGSVLTLPDTVFEPIRARIDPDRRLTRLQVRAARTAPAEMEALIAEHGGRRANRGEALAALAALAFVWALRQMDAAPGTAAAGGGASARLAERFQGLLDRHHGEWHAVGAYAAALSVTPPHLSRACREALGQPASALIRERQMLEARRLLAYTQASVAEVAYRLGFSDPGYFSRVFTSQTGVSPRDFRRRFTSGAG
ncbi:helix-turn-helix domain-containing protein [Stappia sp. MMSF_3263]|uniref:helix-turn-helix domain-containing protein n=1 Tax=Stappia sp. MMSF_3263 TaxID=3046693 RepID=UPI00273F540D|nr:helix-turn-helix domain-containing protein [Stappia sp. MMSF_3263]